MQETLIEQRSAALISDAIMVALLREAMIPTSSAAKTAAQILLEQIRRDHRIDVSERTIEVVRADAGVEVAQEMETLAGRFGEPRSLRH
jgi:hypothetical protein